MDYFVACKQGGQQHEQHRRKVSAQLIGYDTDELLLLKRKATRTSPGQDHGDPPGPDKSQGGACGRARLCASALAAGWLK